MYAYIASMLDDIRQRYNNTDKLCVNVKQHGFLVNSDSDLLFRRTLQVLGYY